MHTTSAGTEHETEPEREVRAQKRPPILLDQIRGVLENVRSAGEGFTARCPAHADANNSLKVDPKDGGGVLAHCFVGCSFEAIRQALEARGVSFENPDRKPATASASKTTTRYEIMDPNGKLIATKCRTDPGKIIWWELPDGTRGLRGSGLRTEDMLYRIESLAARPDSSVVICEGEKAARALYRLGVMTAIGTTGGANASVSAKALEPLRGREVFLWPDNDDPGRKHMAGIRAKLIGIASAVHTIRWADAPDKGDAADWTPGKALSDFDVLANEATATPAPVGSKTMREHTDQGADEAEDLETPDPYARGFVPLPRTLLTSSLWTNETPSTFKAWLALLSLADHETGIAPVSGPQALACQAAISKDEAREAIARLSAPDPESRSTAFDGRRIESVEGGFLLLGHERHAWAMRHGSRLRASLRCLPPEAADAHRREVARARKARARAKAKGEPLPPLPPLPSPIPSSRLASGPSASFVDRAEENGRETAIETGNDSGTGVTSVTSVTRREGDGTNGVARARVW